MSVTVLNSPRPLTSLFQVRLADFDVSLKEVHLSIPYGTVESGTARLLQCTMETDKRNFSKPNPLMVGEHTSQYLIESVNLELEANFESSFLTVRGTVPIHPNYPSTLYCMVEASKDFTLSADEWGLQQGVQVTSDGMAVETPSLSYSLDTQKPQRMGHFVTTIHEPFSVTAFHLSPHVDLQKLEFPTFVSNVDGQDHDVSDLVLPRTQTVQCTVHVRTREEDREEEYSARFLEFTFTKTFETEVTFPMFRLRNGAYSVRYSCPSIVLNSHSGRKLDLVKMSVRLFGDDPEVHYAFIKGEKRVGSDGDGSGSGSGNDSSNWFYDVGMIQTTCFVLGLGLAASVVFLMR